MADKDAPSATSLREFLRREYAEYFKPSKSDRPWQLPFAIAVASGLPMLLGAWLGNLAAGTVASIGAMTIVYLPRTRLDLRMVTVMAVSCAMIASFALGHTAKLVPELRVPIIALVSLLVTMACRYFRIAPPGPLFFVMATAIGAYAPGTIEQLPQRLGLFALGSVFAVAVSFLYSLHILRRRDPLPLQSPSGHFLDEVLVDSVIIGVFTGLSLAMAELLSFDKPYWVPVSCLAVIQGSRLRLVWNRQVQRIVGTLAGLVLTWLLFRFATSPWHFAIAVPLLLFCVETIIVRHYAMAAVFITPLAIALAEATHAGSVDATPLLIARFADTVLGSLMGVLGGICIHRPSIRSRILVVLERLIPRRR